MRATLTAFPMMMALACAMAWPASGETGDPPDESKSVEQAPDSAATGDEPETADAAAKAAAPRKFVVPPGYRTKRRGDHVVYCRKESQQGSRLEAEKCYDEAGLREIEAARREDQERIDQIRKVRSAGGVT